MKRNKVAEEKSKILLNKIGKVKAMELVHAFLVIDKLSVTERASWSEVLLILGFTK